MGSEAFVAKCIADFPTSISAGTVAFDIGANHGSYSVEMAKKFSKVYAFEPEATNFATLTGNLKDYENTIPVNKAISDVSGTATLTPSSNPGGHSISPLVRLETKWGHEAAKSYEVPAITIDDFCDEIGTKPSLIKMDIEGAENFVFAGAKKLLSSHKLSIIIEVHHTVDLVSLWDFFVPYSFHITKDDGTAATNFQYDVHYYLTNLLVP
jgi:FkbM family methyltransferase